MTYEFKTYQDVNDDYTEYELCKYIWTTVMTSWWVLLVYVGVWDFTYTLHVTTWILESVSRFGVVDLSEVAGKPLLSIHHIHIVKFAENL